MLVEHAAEEAALRSDALILMAPMIHYGFNEHNMGFSWHDQHSRNRIHRFLYDVAHSFVRQGFDRIVFVNGHGSNQMLCNLAARRIVNTTRALAAMLATPEKGPAFAECAIRNLVAFARLFRDLKVHRTWT